MNTIRTDLSSGEAARYTVGGLLAERAMQDPDHPAQVFRGGRMNQTYEELNTAADNVAKALIALLGDQRSHAAIWAPNVREWLMVEFGAARAGIPLVMINTNLRARDLEYILRQSDTRILFFCGPEAEPRATVPILEEICPEFYTGNSSRAACKRLPHLEHLIFLKSDPAPGTTGWDDFLKKGMSVSDATLRKRAEEVSPADIFSIQYTSGTTGVPKGALLPHTTYTINGFAAANRQGLDSSDIFCIPLPFFHVYGNVSVISAFAAGGSVATIERFNPVTLLETIESCRVTAICGTPTMFIAAFEEMERNRYDLSSLKGGSMAGSPCPPDLVRRVCTEMGASGFGVLYGFTEAIITMMNAPDNTLQHRTETLGTALPDVHLRIVDPGTGQDLQAGEHGELIVKTPTMMLGYYKMPEMTAAAIDADGWYHTGDMVCADRDGYYSITGRIKDMIIRGGENLFPAEIEAFLLSHPKILDAQVIGVPDAYYGEEPVAFVRLKPGESATPLELKQYFRASISMEKVPATFFFVDTYPLTASGKVQKYVLRDMAADLLSASQER